MKTSFYTIRLNYVNYSNYLAEKFVPIHLPWRIVKVSLEPLNNKRSKYNSDSQIMFLIDFQKIIVVNVTFSHSLIGAFYKI